MSFIALTPQALLRKDPNNLNEKMGFNTDNIIDFTPSNTGGTTIYTISGIRSVEESFDEVFAKCSGNA